MDFWSSLAGFCLGVSVCWVGLGILGSVQQGNKNAIWMGILLALPGVVTFAAILLNH